MLGAASFGAAASSTVDLQGTAFSVDTVEHYYVGPGITHTQLQLNAGSRMVRIYAATLDKADPLYTPAAKARVEIGKDRCLTAETVTSMAERNDSESRRYVAGVNGDFFITSSFAAQHEFGNAILGYPNMSCVIDGKIAAPDMIDITSRENALIIGPEGMWIDATDLTYKVLNNDGSVQVKAKAVNYPRRNNEMMVYNSYMGATTGTAAGGREIALRLADGASWRVNASVKFVVDGEWSSAGNMPVPADGIVISCGPDYSDEFIDGLKDGDTVKLKIILSLPAFDGIKPDITHVIGGDVRILKEGVVTTEAIRWINTPTARYARSLTGYSQDRQRLVMAAVDGGNGSSGLSYFESADLMAYLGCYDALDLDGGGSTALYLRHCGIVNRPRDGSERAVGNALYFTLDNGGDNTVASIRFADHARTIPVYGSYKPVVYGYNAAGMLVDTDVQGAVFAAPEGMAEDIEGGILAVKEGCYALQASLNGMVATMPLTVDGSVPAEAVVSSMLIDAARRPQVKLQAKVGTNIMDVASEAFEWSSTDTEVVTVDENGVLTGLKNGTATVVAQRGECNIPVSVTVEIASSKSLPLDADFGGEGWRFSRSSVSQPEVSALPDGGRTIKFDVTSARTPSLTIRKNIVAYSLPDRLSLTVDPAGTETALTLALQPANAPRQLTVASEPFSTSTKTVFELSELFDTSDITAYPVEFKSLQMTAPSKIGHSCVFRFDDVVFEYDNAEASVENVAVDGVADRLPLFVIDGVLTTSAAVERISIYTPAGVCVKSVAGNSVALDFCPGIYIVKAETASRVMTAKIRL